MSGRNVGLRILLARSKMAKELAQNRHEQPVAYLLKAPLMAPAIHRRDEMEHTDRHQAKEADQGGQFRVVMRRSKDHIADVVKEVNDQDECNVKNDIEYERDQSQEMQTACGLSSAEQFWIPGKARNEGWGHTKTGQDHEGRHDKHDGTVSQLL